MKDIILKNYDFIQTNDGSYTAYSKIYGESCHSTHGAIEETNKHYIDGCKVRENALLYSPINILEVGLGVGIGLTQTLKALEGQNLHFVTMEIDEDIVLHLKENLYELQDLEKVYDSNIYKLYELEVKNVKVSILVGDARATLSEYLKKNNIKFHAIYQDAFSPKKNATLWTKEWFMLLKSCAHSEVIMSTYSSSSSIRKAMIAAGWSVKPGDKFGNKRSSTRAVLNDVSDESILEHLKRSPVILLTDENAHEYTIKATDDKK